MRSFPFLTLFTLCFTLSDPLAATNVIGTVTSDGAFRLNGDTVIANGTVTEGAVIETGRGNLSVRLTGGPRLFLSVDSRVKLYRDHITLEKGETRVENGAEFHLEALGLTIRPDRGISTSRIALLSSNQLRVAALTGSFQVLNTRGVLVGNVAAGSALAFEPLAPAAAAVTHITGTLTEQSGRFLLTDRVTRVTVEVTGQGLAAHVGRLVQVTGTRKAGATPIAPASQVIAATSVQAMAAATGRAAGKAASGAVAAGIGGAIGSTIGVNSMAVVGGIAAVASVGGLAASGALPDQTHSAPLDVPAGLPVTPPGQPPGRPPVTPPGQPPGRPPVTPPGQPPGQPPGRPPVTPPGLSR